MASATGSSCFTANETAIITTIFRYLQGEVQTDWQKVASDLGYKNINVAKTRFAQIKKKKLEGTPPSDVAKSKGAVNSAGTPDNAKTGAKRSRKPAKSKESKDCGTIYDEDAEGEESDTKKIKLEGTESG